MASHRKITFAPGGGCWQIFVVAVLLCRSVFAADYPAYNSRLWQTEEGLPHNIVQTITQTSDGFLWVGTREGLAKYDGEQFHSIEFGRDIRHPSILSLLSAKDGSLWIGTENFGIFRIVHGDILRCPNPSGSVNFSALELHEGSNGIWAATSAGVLRYRDGAVQRITNFKGAVQSICIDTNGSAWLAGGGFLRLDAPAVPNEFPLGDVRKAYCDSDGVFWLATWRGLTRFSNGTTNYLAKSEGPSGFISDMVRDPHGQLMTGSYSGLSWFAGGKFVNELDLGELSFRIYSIYIDREQNIWIGSEEGLQRLNRREFKTYTTKDGLTLNTIVSVCASRDGTMWIGAWGGGLNHFVDGKFITYEASNGLSSDFVMGMCERRDGSLWVGTDYGSTLNRLSGGQIEHFGKAQGFNSAVTTALLEDHEGALWIGTRNGLQQLKDGIFHKFTTNDGLANSQINALCESANRLWIGTAAGLSMWNGTNIQNMARDTSRLEIPVLSLYADEAGVLWIGTREDGLMRLKNGAVTEFGMTRGLFSDSIYSIVEDGRSNLWLNSSRGIFRLSKAELEAAATDPNVPVNSIAYGKADGIISSGQYRDVTQPASCRARDGRLWFRTTQGVAVVDPDKIIDNKIVPPVVIEAVVADRVPLNLADGSRGPGSELRLDAGRGEVEIHYAALSFRAPEKNQYKYLLLGEDRDWIDAGTRRVAYYNNLSPGDYVFRVKACNNDGHWNETGDTLPFRLLPHFWQTWWFYSVSTVSTLAGISGLVRYTTRRKMQRRLADLQRQNAIEQERARIARDIHDDIGAGLTEIALTGEMVEDASVAQEEKSELAREISSRARDLVTRMDEIVWAINPRHDTVRSAAAYFRQFAQRFLKPAGIRCRLEADPELPDLPLSSEQRHHLFLAFKEALNNAARHARATEVRLAIRIENETLVLRVHDNGVGLPSDPPPGSGNGLVNMKNRMARIGARFEVTGRPGEGTGIVFGLPLRGRL